MGTWKLHVWTVSQWVREGCLVEVFMDGTARAHAGAVTLGDAESLGEALALADGQDGAPRGVWEPREWRFSVDRGDYWLDVLATGRVVAGYAETVGHEHLGIHPSLGEAMAAVGAHVARMAGEVTREAV